MAFNNKISTKKFGGSSFRLCWGLELGKAGISERLCLHSDFVCKAIIFLSFAFVSFDIKVDIKVILCMSLMWNKDGLRHCACCLWSPPFLSVPPAPTASPRSLAPPPRPRRPPTGRSTPPGGRLGPGGRRRGPGGGRAARGPTRGTSQNLQIEIAYS